MFISPNTRNPVASLLLGSLAALSWSSSAEACGGLFCSSSAPVNQTAERIIFAQDGDVTTQIVEILYEGPSERFAWVLPVPGIPDVAVSSSVVFQRLQQATNPSYTLNVVMPEGCEGLARGLLGDADTAQAGTSGNFTSGPSVSVLDAGSVGPYDFEVIAVEAGDADPADVAVRWLEANDYDVGALGPDVLRPYLDAGLNLIAVRLQKGVSTGSIRPLSLTFQSAQPSIPIRPTAVAAAQDMGILVWVLGDSRAVPTNYKGLELNEMFIDWTNPGPTYNQVVSLAADEAGGQGFVTEMAGPAAPFHDVIDPGVEVLPVLSSDTDVGAQVLELTQRYGQYDGYARVFTQNVTLAETVDIDAWIQCPYCNPSTASGDPAGDVVTADVAALVQGIEDEVLQPIYDAADLFQDHAYVTRLYTTMSADEMDEDPLFDFNPDLENVSNVHTAEQRVTCDGVGGPWKVTLANGRVIYGEGFSWPLTPSAASDIPVTNRILTFKTSGAPDVDRDNTAEIDTQFALTQASQPNGADGGLSCATSARRGSSLAPFGLALLAGAAFLRSRRRAKQA